VARSEKSFAMLNRYPYNSGHLMVAPFRHVGELEEVEDEESRDMQRLMQRCVKALNEAMQPDGFNIGMNLGVVAGAGIPDHLHWHIVPRWQGDTNFMPVVGAGKVLPQALSDTYSAVSRSISSATTSTDTPRARPLRPIKASPDPAGDHPWPSSPKTQPAS